MNVGFVFVILMAMCAAVMGLFMIAAHAQTDANVDTYGHVDTNSTNLTRDNVTAAMPVGTSILGYSTILIGVLCVVIVIGALFYTASKVGQGYGRR